MRLAEVLSAIKPYVLGWIGSYPPPACHVYHNAAQSINHNSAAVLVFNSERYDGAGLHSTSSNTSRVTVAVAGKYRLAAGAEWASNANGQRVLNIRLNGSTVIASDLVNAAGTFGTRQDTVIEYALAVNDYVEVEVYQNSGGSLDVNATSCSPWLAVSWLGA